MGGSLENFAVYTIDWSSEMVSSTFVFEDLSRFRDRVYIGWRPQLNCISARFDGLVASDFGPDRVVAENGRSVAIVTGPHLVLCAA